MSETVSEGHEYLLLKQTPLPKKIARVFAILWIVCIICPSAYFFHKNAALIKEYAVVQAAASVSDMLLQQYDSLIRQTVEKADIEKYTGQIQLPEIKADQINETVQKVQTGAAVLEKLGVKNASKAVDTSSQLQTQLSKINDQIQSSLTKAKEALNQNITKALLNEASSLGNAQVQKQLNLSESAFNTFSKGEYGLLSEGNRNATKIIYNGLKKSPLLEKILIPIDQWFCYFACTATAILILILLIPVFLAFKLAKMLSANFMQCPYCKKVFISKTAKINLFKSLLK